MAKTYEVIFQGEYNNLYFLGFYAKLEDSLKDINDMLEVYNVKLDEIHERPSTFDLCFDTDIEIEEGMVQIRGFVFEDMKGDCLNGRKAKLLRNNPSKC